ncbi:MAG: putative sulfate exporter family transporter, partial [bacterium]|nr:putative sulfate exporter family transporter [bacterium]
MKYIYGIILCIVIGIVSLLLSAYIPIGGVSIAIILGIVIGNILKPGEIFKKGITYSESRILSLAIILMGVNLNFLVLRNLGYKSILLIIGAVAVTLLSSIVLAKIFKFDGKFALLLGIGNGICGASAIAAVKPIIGKNETEVGLSISIVNFLGTIGIFLLPFIGGVVLKFTDLDAGVLIGNTLQAVGQVVAAGFSISEPTGHVATIVKMGRILMLIPIVLIFIFAFSRKDTGRAGGEETKKTGVPIFIIGFILFSLIPTFGLLPEDYIKVVSKISHYALIIAMAGIGLKITFGSILRDGKKALLIGSLIFVLQILF